MSNFQIQMTGLQGQSHIINEHKCIRRNMLKCNTVSFTIQLQIPEPTYKHIIMQKYSKGLHSLKIPDRNLRVSNGKSISLNEKMHQKTLAYHS